MKISWQALLHFFLKFSQNQLKMLFLQVIHEILQPSPFPAIFFFPPAECV